MTAPELGALRRVVRAIARPPRQLGERPQTGGKPGKVQERHYLRLTPKAKHLLGVTCDCPACLDGAGLRRPPRASWLLSAARCYEPDEIAAEAVREWAIEEDT
jgi:hypothetical protein